MSLGESVGQIHTHTHIRLSRQPLVVFPASPPNVITAVQPFLSPSTMEMPWGLLFLRLAMDDCGGWPSLVHTQPPGAGREETASDTDPGSD